MTQVLALENMIGLFGLADLSAPLYGLCWHKWHFHSRWCPLSGKYRRWRLLLDNGWELGSRLGSFLL